MLIRAALIAAFLATSLFAQQPQTGQLDANPALFTILAAMNAAGYDADLQSPANHPLRKALRDFVAKKNLLTRRSIGASTNLRHCFFLPPLRPFGIDGPI